MERPGCSQYTPVGSLNARISQGVTLEELAGIYRAEVAEVWNFLLRLGARREWLGDLTHDVFVVAIRRRDQFDPSRPARAWLFGIAYRVLLDFRRLAVHRHEVASEGAPVVELRPEVEARLEQRDAWRTLWAALEHLEFDRRTVVVMHELHELSIPDVAEALGIPLGTAYSRLRLGRIDLTSAVRKQQRKEASRG